MSDVKKRGLGRGLGALLPDAPSRPSTLAGGTAPGTSSGALPGTGSGIGSTAGATITVTGQTPRTYFLAGIEDLYPSPEQPRRRFEEDKLGELADSMKAHGVIVPLVVRPRPDGGYYLIAGERRWRAAQKAGLHQVPVVVQDVEESTAFERALVENLQRADLGPLEEAAAYQRMVDQLGYTQERIAERIGKDRSTVANMVRLLKLPTSARQLVDDGKLSMGHARALLGLDDVAAIERTARAVIDRQLSVRATEALVKKAKSPEKPAKPAAAKSASVRDLEERLTRSLGGPVKIAEDAPGKSGRIEIRYMDLDHLERLLDRLL